MVCGSFDRAPAPRQCPGPDGPHPFIRLIRALRTSRPGNPWNARAEAAIAGTYAVGTDAFGFARVRAPRRAELPRESYTVWLSQG
jgi:hypothetical protein